MFDCISQSVLKPYHDYFARILRNFPSDFTFDQDAGRNRVLEATKSGMLLYSFDLKDATDRLPRSLIKEVLLFYLPETEVDLLMSIMCDREFKYPFPPQVKNPKIRTIRYSVGTPMGGLGSFTAGLALPHHHIIQLAAVRAGFEGIFLDYVVLGDDVVIFNEKVARQYRKIIGELNMKISESKSLIGLGIAEFAKSIYVKGTAITPVSWKLLRQLLNDNMVFLTFCGDLLKR